MRVETAQHLALARPPAGTARPHEVLVAPGDSLWSISEQALPGATTGEVADHVSRLHAANRAVVGTDPDLIHPGQRLALPDATD